VYLIFCFVAFLVFSVFCMVNAIVNDRFTLGVCTAMALFGMASAILAAANSGARWDMALSVLFFALNLAFAVGIIQILWIELRKQLDRNYVRHGW